MERRPSLVTQGAYANTTYPYEYELFITPTASGTNIPVWTLQPTFTTANNSRVETNVALKLPFAKERITLDPVANVYGSLWTRENVVQNADGAIVAPPTIPVTKTTFNSNFEPVTIVTDEPVTYEDLNGFEARVVTPPTVSVQEWLDHVLAGAASQVLDEDIRLNINGVVYKVVSSYNAQFSNLTASISRWSSSAWATSDATVYQVAYQDVTRNWGELLEEGVWYPIVRGVSKYDNLVVNHRKPLDTLLAQSGVLTYCQSPAPAPPAPQIYTILTTHDSSNVCSETRLTSVQTVLTNFLQDDIPDHTSEVVGEITVACRANDWTPAGEYAFFLQFRVHDMPLSTHSFLSKNPTLQRSFASLVPLLSFDGMLPQDIVHLPNDAAYFTGYVHSLGDTVVNAYHFGAFVIQRNVSTQSCISIQSGDVGHYYMKNFALNVADPTLTLDDIVASNHPAIRAATLPDIESNILATDYAFLQPVPSNFWNQFVELNPVSLADGFYCSDWFTCTQLSTCRIATGVDMVAGQRDANGETYHLLNGNRLLVTSFDTFAQITAEPTPNVANPQTSTMLFQFGPNRELPLFCLPETVRLDTLSDRFIVVPTSPADCTIPSETTGANWFTTMYLFPNLFHEH